MWLRNLSICCFLLLAVQDEFVVAYQRSSTLTILNGLLEGAGLPKAKMVISSSEKNSGMNILTAVSFLDFKGETCSAVFSVGPTGNKIEPPGISCYAAARKSKHFMRGARRHSKKHSRSLAP